MDREPVYLRPLIYSLSVLFVNYKNVGQSKISIYQEYISSIQTSYSVNGRFASLSLTNEPLLLNMVMWYATMNETTIHKSPNDVHLCNFKSVYGLQQ